jgi:hypothetical protein
MLNFYISAFFQIASFSLTLITVEFTHGNFERYQCKKVFLFTNIMAVESGPVLLMWIMLLQESQFIADSKCRCNLDFKQIRSK